jgi:bacterioferritin
MGLAQFAELPGNWNLDGVSGFGFATTGNATVFGACETGEWRDVHRAAESESMVEQHVETRVLELPSVLDAASIDVEDVFLSRCPLGESCGTTNQYESFIDDVEMRCKWIRESIDKRSLTESFGEHGTPIVFVLSQMFAIKVTGMLRYKQHFTMTEGLNIPSTADEFLQRAAQESTHSDMIAARIEQLGGPPDLFRGILATRERSGPTSLRELNALIREDLAAEEMQISTFAEIAAWVGDGDVTTRDLIRQILAFEKENAEDMRDLLLGVSY